MIDLIHEILNDYLVVISEGRKYSSAKVIKQEDLRKISKEINEAIKKEKT